MASASDNFNRTENPLSDGGAWTTGVYNSNNLKTDGSHCVGAVGGDYNFGYRNSPSIGVDQFSEAYCNVTANSEFFICARVSGSGGTLKAYLAYVKRTSEFNVFKYDGGFSSLQTNSRTNAAGTYRIEVTTSGGNSTIKLLFNGSQINSDYTESTSIASGQPGVAMLGTGAGEGDYLDDWQGGDLGGGGGGGGGNPWYAYAQQRRRLGRLWRQTSGVIWTPSYALRAA